MGNEILFSGGSGEGVEKTQVLEPDRAVLPPGYLTLGKSFNPLGPCLIT